jgi:Fe(3+) dicitrate transport protein
MRLNSGRAGWLASSALIVALPAMAWAETSIDSVELIETITVVGHAGGAENVAGSVSYISSEDLARQASTDILRVLRTVPGVNLQEEEGYGLRPNIGLRGSGSDRNSRVVVMEDGVPVAPAIYSSPSAYYFPATGRISAVEIVKGPAVVQYGPRTTGGAIHLFSTPIPNVTEGFAELMTGEYGRTRFHGWAGSTTQLANGLEAGFLIETYQDEAEGFLERDNGGDTGFDIADYVVKAGLGGDFSGRDWALELKYQTKDETSDQTYMGLTQADYDADPFRLYGSTLLDEMNNDNELFQLTGQLDLSDNWRATATAYSNEFSRNWYKVQGVSAAGNGAADDVGIGLVLADPVTFAAELALLRGDASLDDSIVLRANNRTYYTRGIQGVIDGGAELFGLRHNLQFGVRYLSDEEDRFQNEDAYRLDAGGLTLTTPGAPGSTTNRLTQADALAVHALNTTDLTDRLQLTAGLRYESYEITREDFSTTDPTRANGATRVRSVDHEVVLPSFALLYDANEYVTLLAGVHRGFSPSGPTSGSAEDERSTNYELGARFVRGGFNVEAIAFFNDYENLLGECTNSTGGNCAPGQAFDGGAFTARGLEVQARGDIADWIDAGGLSLPVGVSYTFTDTEFQTSFINEFFGVVRAGDGLNYVPENQWTLQAGVMGERWGADAVIAHVSEARGTIGAGPIQAGDRIDARTLVDVAGYIEVMDNVRLTAKAENLFDETYVAARRPAGLRPGKPRELLVGLQLRF